ncbi:MAG: Rdx family protein [Planctomycetes bacterium]|nr:Rdx family protein [Planctomycetota bacterium]
MAAAIKEQFGADVQLIEGAGGIFDVKVDGRLIFSKHDQGRFPEHAEILSSLAASVT